jgi:hypothetical protein
LSPGNTVTQLKYLNGTCKFVVYPNDVNILDESINTIKKNTEAPLDVVGWLV